MTFPRCKACGMVTDKEFCSSECQVFYDFEIERLIEVTLREQGERDILGR